MPPRSFALLPAATVDPRAPKKLVCGRWAHDRARPARHGHHQLVADVAVARDGCTNPARCSSASRDPWPIWT
eukprot:58641-Prymnesium_polylepis.1